MWEDRFESATDSGFKRDEYGRDRARIIHSAFFRRLQGKTQVLGLGESDFYRTRLTHSLEVAQIAGGISEFLKVKYKDNQDLVEIVPEQSLIESIGLVHDIGHPPFGHGGEVALNYAMSDHSGFEGNAQTLRICTKLGEYSDNGGLNLTRRTLLGIIKYPCLYSDVVNKNKYKKTKTSCDINFINLDDYKPPKCVFDCDKENIDWILSKFNKKDREIFMSSNELSESDHRKPLYKSFDASIMELADDIAYGVHDLEDSIALRLVNEKTWRSQVVDILMDPLKKFPLSDRIIEYTNLLFSGENKTRKKAISALVNYFVTKSEYKKLNKFSHELLDYQAVFPDIIKEELDILKKFVVDNVIKTPEVQTLEYKGQQMILKLFEAIKNNPSRLLPKRYYQRYKNEGENLRVICDYLAGTTDDYATRLYHKIFTPSSGSIFDRL
ncbi:deoxyguanosinetriphosphate triphosphohydrolase family protein [Morganella morganii]|uniref:anti-phage deoxyguanosine triphosphatase n=1 Tax=Morganella morganii TaxID=582 RepID=UPI001BDAEDAA|nr:anti-phage deoxyguanosine triphosphatase [Morganella morganii]ELF0883191.1 deoxyguanosinetriphosphate triphosphohydrolase family protein [Morganella morganii]MBT0388356.1 deoxyguanosinetriphosphate triphosphohydrolase family protein [Morganella morganii subsp. morganii]HEJ1048982.1 deoxyguanosinetriphosphate triphosphohydrolase family protein [Morganella morganii]